MIWEVALLMLLFAYLGRWLLSGWTGRDAARLDPGHTAELARLREEMDQLTAQVARLQEEQSFTMRLLGEGGGAARVPALDAGEPDPTTNAEKP
jgi:hypothetical protein